LTLMSDPKPAAAHTTTRILDVAERLVQTRGFNGFSYADIAAEVGITKASLHYHFATKAELGCTLIERYSAAFESALHKIARERAAVPARLRAYVKLYADVLADERMCLCGMLAAEYATLPESMQRALQAFFAANERWLAQLLELGQQAGSLTLRGSAPEAAAMLVGALEGAMLLARASGEPAKFTAAARLLLAQLESPAADATSRRARVARFPARPLRRS
jgi:TetR/AcrR family transcriptional repressor of nem operon